MRVTQKDRVLQYIRETGSITRAEGFTQLGITELASRIGELEDQGYRFEREPLIGKNRYGDTVRYIRYKLKEQSNEKN
jgi:hypothetical protein